MLTGSLQTLLPGERARPHRHTMDALRFALTGEGAETIVDGKPCPMEPGDLILTPGWTWHEHIHHGAEPVIWLDVLNLMLHETFATARFQPGPVREAEAQYDDAAFAVANMVPVMGWQNRSYSPVFRYPWAAAVEAVAAAPAAPDGSRRARYVNPMTGGSCMALIDCSVLELPGALETAPFRSSAGAICSVVEGVGISTFEDGSQIDWAPRDTFTLPPNQKVVHRAGPAGARLFVASDRAAYERLGLLREEFVA
jgi:gentisate 1,2-dioxygenase